MASTLIMCILRFWRHPVVNNGSNVPDVYAQIADVILRVVDTLLQLPQKVMTSAQLRDQVRPVVFFCETTFFMWVHDLKTELYIHAQCSSTARIIWGPGSGPLRSAVCPLIFWEKRDWRMLGSGLFVIFFYSICINIVTSIYTQSDSVTNITCHRVSELPEV